MNDRILIQSTTPHLIALQELGRRLARLRKQQGLTQAALAQEAGLGVATIIRIEGGQDAQFSSWIKIFKVLNLSSVLETLLPESVLSPMSEVLGQKQQQKRRQKRQNKNNPLEKKHIWGDGKT